MKFETDITKEKRIKFTLWAMFSASLLVIFLCIGLIFTFANHPVACGILGVILILLSIFHVLYILFLTKALENLSTLEIYPNENELLFYHVQKDGNEDGFGALHIYSRAKSIKKITSHKHFICIKGQFQDKHEGYPVLECQNNDEEKSRLTFSEQCDLVFFENSHLKSYTMIIPRTLSNADEQTLLKLLNSL